jgi:hypothetical protein
VLPSEEYSVNLAFETVDLLGDSRLRQSLKLRRF